MVIKKDIVYGGANVGVYLAMNNQFLIHPPKINPNLIEFVKKIHPDMQTIETFINGSAVVGSYIAFNSKGMIVPHIISDEELTHLQQNFPKNYPITLIESENNAFGNIVLCNDHGAIIPPTLIEFKDIIAETLGVNVEISIIAGSKLPGSCGLANNSGAVLHPMVDDSEAKLVQDTLNVDVDVSTINCGSPFLGGGAIVNDYGAIFGRDTTGPEIQRIMEVLNLE